jgi:hypothetical protein
MTRHADVGVKRESAPPEHVSRKDSFRSGTYF